MIQNNKIINNIYEYDCFDDINGNVELIYLDEIDIEDVDKEDVDIAPLVNITKKWRNLRRWSTIKKNENHPFLRSSGGLSTGGILVLFCFASQL